MSISMSVFICILDPEGGSQKAPIVVVVVRISLRFDSHCRPFASNLEQVANPLCQLSFLRLAGSVTYGPRGEGLV